MLALLVFTLGLSLGLADDPFRPKYHFLPEKNWLNDPNGPIFYNGFYHMFFQYNPNAPLEEEIHEGHAYSRDMIHWIRLPVALAPDQPYDINGVLTGSTTIVNGMPIIMYAGINENNEQVLCQARPANATDPTLRVWIKSSLNPMITHPFGRDPATAFQDDEGFYYLIYGYGTEELGGQAVLFMSRDFLNWTYLHSIHGNHYDSFWECPDIFNVSDRLAMKASLLSHDFWTVGEFDRVQKIFLPLAGDLGEYTQLVDPGKFYASKSFYDPSHNQQVLVGWIDEDDNMGVLRGWQGLHSLPRTIFLSEDGLQVRSRPIDAIHSLRNETTHQVFHNLALSSTNPYAWIPHVSGNQIEISIIRNFPADQIKFGLHVLSTPDGNQRTSIGVMTRTTIEWMVHWDLVGYDYLSAIDIVNVYPCQQACNQDERCRAWTFVSNQLIDANGFLKTGIPRLEADPACRSGIKHADTRDQRQLVWIYINRTLSQYNSAASRIPIAGTVWMQSTEMTSSKHWLLELDVFIHHSVIEIFEPRGGRLAMTARVYPEEETARNLAVYYNPSINADPTIVIDALNVWNLNSTWISNVE